MRIDGSKILNPGLLRHRITWRTKYVTGQDAFGANETINQTVAVCKAHIRELLGYELQAARQVWSEARFELTQHYIDGLTCDMEIVWGDRVLNPHAITDPAETKRYQVIIASVVK